MIKYNFLTLKKIEDNNLYNVAESPVWLLNIEKIFHKGYFYLKTYVYKNIADVKINEITFLVTYNDQRIIQKVSDISRADSYPNDPVFGCLVKLPIEYNNEDFELKIIGLVIDTQIYDYSESNQEKLFFSKIPFENEMNIYLRRNLSNFLVFPSFNEDNWSCTCGKINKLSQLECTNCFNSRDEVISLCDKGIKFSTIEIYVKNNPFQFSPSLTFENAYDNYNLKLKSQFNIEDNFLSKFITDEDEKRYLEQIDAYNIKKEEELSASKKKRKRTLKFGLISLIIFLIGTYVVNYGSETATYGSGLYKLWTSNYEEASSEFESIKTFANAQSMVYEVDLKWAVSIFDNNPKTSISLLEKIPNLNHGDAKSVYDDFVYSYAQTLFEKMMYQDAADYFNRIDYKDSINQYKESNYLLAKDYYKSPDNYKKAIETIKVVSVTNYKDSASLLSEWQYQKAKEYLADKNYVFAIKELESLGSYEDSTQLLQDSRYLEAVRLMNKKDYINAITYFNKTGNYKDTQTKIKESNYQIGINYLSKKDYTNALTFFNKIKGYRDANSKIYSIEEIIYAWEVRIYFNTSENSTSDNSKISRYSPVYIHFEVSGGRPGETIKIKYVYTYPYGNVGSDTTYEMYDGGDYWTGWDNGIYYTPSQGTVGYLKVNLYNAKNGKFLGSDSVYIDY